MCQALRQASLRRTASLRMKRTSKSTWSRAAGWGCCGRVGVTYLGSDMIEQCWKIIYLWCCLIHIILHMIPNLNKWCDLHILLIWFQAANVRQPSPWNFWPLWDRCGTWDPSSTGAYSPPYCTPKSWEHWKSWWIWLNFFIKFKDCLTWGK